MNLILLGVLIVSELLELRRIIVLEDNYTTNNFVDNNNVIYAFQTVRYDCLLKFIE